MVADFAITYPVLVHRAAGLLRASFRPHLIRLDRGHCTSKLSIMLGTRERRSPAGGAQGRIVWVALGGLAFLEQKLYRNFRVFCGIEMPYNL
jgi:hypothetical protein